MAPSKARVLNMEYPVLIGHYSLIRLKKSSLSSTQRARVTRRIEHLISKNKISQQQIDDSFDKLKRIE